MQLTDKFQFGQYHSLTLKEVYEGTDKIDRELIKNFLNKCLKDENVPKPVDFGFCDVFLTKDEIKIIPQIFDEDKPESPDNVVFLGNLSKKLEHYFNEFFRENWYGIVENLMHFNKNCIERKVIGGDPKYIQWCRMNYNGFNLDIETISQLEVLEVNYLLGISVTETSTDRYSYNLIIQKEFYKFP